MFCSWFLYYKEKEQEEDFFVWNRGKSIGNVEFNIDSDLVLVISREEETQMWIESYTHTQTSWYTHTWAPGSSSRAHFLVVPSKHQATIFHHACIMMMMPSQVVCTCSGKDWSKDTSSILTQTEVFAADRGRDRVSAWPPLPVSLAVARVFVPVLWNPHCHG